MQVGCRGLGLRTPMFYRLFWFKNGFQLTPRRRSPVRQWANGQPHDRVRSGTLKEESSLAEWGRAGPRGAFFFSAMLHIGDRPSGLRLWSCHRKQSSGESGFFFFYVNNANGQRWPAFSSKRPKKAEYRWATVMPSRWERLENSAEIGAELIRRDAQSTRYIGGRKGRPRARKRTGWFLFFLSVVSVGICRAVGFHPLTYNRHAGVGLFRGTAIF